ncbi:hypothetical protein IEO21_06225 [Rhodonia placenta]|uniref:Uncharacterized protein n=1 Tax=Rhodonia placenta TaxID=104341 RepID=A0A8H7U1C2_9APHY|nr:hypothetical protein IEO21_06225 [Postia placenta]
MNENERVRAAITMTLCELGTAKHNSPPLECAAFAVEMRSTDKNTPNGPPGACVEALSRSTQHWSSYSGYLREVSQLCYAFRRWNDIDTAREIYRNATIGQVEILQHLNEREEQLQEYSRRSDLFLQVYPAFSR